MEILCASFGQNLRSVVECMYQKLSVGADNIEDRFDCGGDHRCA